MLNISIIETYLSSNLFDLQTSDEDASAGASTDSGLPVGYVLMSLCNPCSLFLSF